MRIGPRALLLCLCTVLLALPWHMPRAGAEPSPDAGRAETRIEPRIETSELKSVQRRLNRLHCDAGRGDGRMDRQLRSAVFRFKTRHGLTANGQVTRRTRAVLFSARAHRCDRRPVPAGTGRGRRIVVSQHQNWVWLVRSGGRVAAQAPMIDNPRVLRPGRYSTGSYCGRAARVRHNSDLHYRYWLDRFVRFAPCGIGFHRIPRWKSSGRQIHPGWWLGTDFDRSDGCLRLSRRFSERVWDFTAAGRTRVVVR